MNPYLKEALKRLCEEFKTFEAGRGRKLTEKQHDRICYVIEKEPRFSVIEAAWILGIIK